MRYGVLADVHGNLHALGAVLGALERLGVDAYLCAGDVVGYGALPNECAAALAALDARCVAGNHDLIALGRLSDHECIRLARDSLRWTREQLTPETRRFLDALPPVLTTADGVVLAHGSLRDPREYVREGHQRAAQLRELRASRPQATVLVLGHTHLPAAHSERRGTLAVRDGSPVPLDDGDRVLLNPGSVGQSRDRSVQARFLVLDMDRREARFHAVRFDVRGCRRALRAAGLPPRSHHVHRSAMRRYGGRVRRALWRVGGRLPGDRQRGRSQTP